MSPSPDPTEQIKVEVDPSPGTSPAARCADGHVADATSTYCSRCGAYVGLLHDDDPPAPGRGWRTRLLIAGTSTLVIAVAVAAVLVLVPGRSARPHAAPAVVRTRPVAVRVTAPTSPPVTVDVPAAKAALASLVQQFGSSYATSDLVSSTQGLLVAVSYDSTSASNGGSTSGGLVNVYRWTGSAWADLGTAGVGNNLDGVATTGAEGPNITVVHLTSASVPDFYVLLQGGDHYGAVVVTDLGGSWHLLPIQGPGTSAELVDPTLDGNQITSRSNNCDPDCADGAITATTYHFDAGSGELVPTGAPVTTPSPPTTAPPVPSFYQVVDNLQASLRDGTMSDAAAVPDAVLDCPDPVAVEDGAAFACNVSSEQDGDSVLIVEFTSNDGTSYDTTIGSNISCSSLDTSQEDALTAVGGSCS